MSERIAIENLQPGMVIVRIVEQNGPVRIKKAGLVTSEDMVRGLAEMGVAEVEIDPEQTVELDSQPEPATGTTSQTQTQALLKGQYDRQGHYDNQLADQFNRNLFLPSVQGIPSLWAVYLRQAAVVVLTMLLGAGLGFAGATYSLWGPNFGNTESAQTKSQEASLQQAQPETQQLTQQQSQQETQEQPEQDVTPAETTTTPAAEEKDNALLESIQQQLAALNDKVDNSQTATQQSEPLTVDDVEGVELTAQQNQDPAAVSPDLLRRFNQAIEELDSEAGSAEPEQPLLTVRDDVQRIDQLPVRLMTTLPTMSFSAHMYASRPVDRWVRVNGQRKQEGDWIDNEVQIINIEAQRVILEYKGELFSMAALTDW